MSQPQPEVNAAAPAAGAVETGPRPKPPGLLKFFLKAPFKIKFKFLVVVFTGLGVLGSAGFGIKKIFSIQIKPKVVEHKPVVEAPKKKIERILELKNLSFSVMDRRRIRNAYVQFSVLIECADDECMRQLELYRAKLIDGVFEVSSHYFVEDFLNPSGAQRFKLDLYKHYTDYFPHHPPMSVSLKEWVMN